MAAAANGRAYVLRLLAELEADITTTDNNGDGPLTVSVQQGHLEATKTLILLGAPVTAQDLRQRDDVPGNARQLRADLQAWAGDALVQRYTFQSTFLFGCSACEGSKLAMLEGEVDVRAEIGAFVGIVVGMELQRLRAVGPAIAAVDWAAHDEEE